MLRYLFATDEVFINEDAQAMQSGAALDISALLAAWCGSVADTGVTSGIDPQAVVSGLTVSGSVSGANASITVATGSLVYVKADTDGVMWRLGSSRAATTLTTPLVTSGNHAIGVVEAVVTETTANQVRTFRRALLGRIVYQDESTPKTVSATVSFRIRMGTTVPTATSPRLDAWSSDGLPLATVLVTDSTVTVTDIRRMVQAGSAGRPFLNPLKVTTDIAPLKSCVLIPQNKMAFGNQTAMDYCDITRTSATYPSEPGANVPTDGVVIAINTVGSIFACRVHPKVGATELIRSYNTYNRTRAYTGAAFTLPAPWPAGSTASGTEVRYLCPAFYSPTATMSTSEVFGTNTKVTSRRPQYTFAGWTSGDTNLVDFSSVVPAHTTSLVCDIVLTMTLPAPYPTYVEAKVNDTGSESDQEIRSLRIGVSGPAATVVLNNVHVHLNRRTDGLKANVTLTTLGPDTGTFNATFLINEVSEGLEQ